MNTEGRLRASHILSYNIHPDIPCIKVSYTHIKSILDYHTLKIKGLELTAKLRSTMLKRINSKTIYRLTCNIPLLSGTYVHCRPRQKKPTFIKCCTITGNVLTKFNRITYQGKKYWVLWANEKNYMYTEIDAGQVLPPDFRKGK